MPAGLQESPARPPRAAPEPEAAAHTGIGISVNHHALITQTAGRSSSPGHDSTCG